MIINDKRKAILENLLVEGETMIDLSPANIKTFVNKVTSILAGFYGEDEEDIPNWINFLLPTTPAEALFRVQNEAQYYNAEKLLSVIHVLRNHLENIKQREKIEQQKKTLKILKIERIILLVCIVLITIFITQCLILIL